MLVHSMAQWRGWGLPEQKVLATLLVIQKERHLELWMEPMIATRRATSMAIPMGSAMADLS
jgi:hypothetical protein